MKVKELIEQLNNLDPEMQVCIYDREQDFCEGLRA